MSISISKLTLAAEYSQHPPVPACYRVLLAGTLRLGLPFPQLFGFLHNPAAAALVRWSFHFFCLFFGGPLGRPFQVSFSPSPHMTWLSLLVTSTRDSPEGCLYCPFIYSKAPQPLRSSPALLSFCHPRFMTKFSATGVAMKVPP